MQGSNNFLHSLHHFLVAFVLCLKGFDKISHGHPVIGGLLLLFGLIILFYFIYTVRTKNSGHMLEDIVHWFEALAALFMAYLTYTDGSKYLHYVFLLAAIGFFIAIYVSKRKHMAGKV